MVKLVFVLIFPQPNALLMRKGLHHLAWSLAQAFLRTTPTPRLVPGSSKSSLLIPSPSMWKCFKVKNSLMNLRSSMVKISFISLLATVVVYLCCCLFTMFIYETMPDVLIFYHTYIHTYICSWRQHFKMYILTPGPSGQSPLLVALSGNHSTQLNFTSKTSQLYLRWSTDHATNKKGFKIRYTGNFRAFRKLPFLFCFYIMTTCCYIASHNTVLSFRQEPVVRSNLDSETCDVNVSPHAGFSSSAGLV